MLSGEATTRVRLCIQRNDCVGSKKAGDRSIFAKAYHFERKTLRGEVHGSYDHAILLRGPRRAFSETAAFGHRCLHWGDSGSKLPQLFLTNIDWQIEN